MALFRSDSVIGYSINNGAYHVDIVKPDNTETDAKLYAVSVLKLPSEVDGVPVKYKYATVDLLAWSSEDWYDDAYKSFVNPLPITQQVNEPETSDTGLIGLRIATGTLQSGCEIAGQATFRRIGGTFSCFVWDKDTAEIYGLSAAHVLAWNRWRDNFDNLAREYTDIHPEEIGSLVYQPRRGRPIGTLSRWGTNTSEANGNVDAALFTVDLSKTWVNIALFGTMGAYPVVETRPAVLGESVQLFGRSMGYQEGTISDLGYVFQPARVPGCVCYRTTQSGLTTHGDSGALVRAATGEHPPLGIVIGSVDGRTIIMPGMSISNNLNVSFVGAAPPLVSDTMRIFPVPDLTRTLPVFTDERILPDIV